MKYFFTILFFGVVGVLAGQDLITIKGQVLDAESSEPMIGVSVQVVGETFGTTTNENGAFELILPTKEYTLLFTYIGHLEREVLVDSSTTLNILLQINYLETEVVTVSYFPQIKNTAPIAYKNIDINTFTSNDETNIAPILNQIPGVFMHTGALNTNRITIRGIGSRSLFSTTKIKAYFNNIPLTTGDGETTLEDIDLSAIDRVTVVRGPTATLSGAGLGGSIFLLKKQVPYKQLNKLSTKFSIGSFGLLRSSNQYALNNEKLSLNLNYTNTQSDGYRDNNEYDRQNVNLIGTYKLNPKAKLSFFGSYIDLTAFIPSSLDSLNFVDNPSSAAFTWQQVAGNEDYYKTLIGVNYEQDFERGFTLNTSVFGSDRNAYEIRPFNNLEEQNQAIGLRSVLSYTANNISANIGTEILNEQYNWKTYEVDNPDNLISDNQEIRRYANVFATATFEWNDWDIVGGLNYNTTNYDYTDLFTNDTIDLSGNYSFQPILSPKVGIKYRINTNKGIHSFFGNISHGFSPPSLSETLTPDGQINPAIQPERGWNYELGARGYIGKLDYDITLYSMQIRDLLVARRTSEDAFIGINAGQTAHNGLELDLKYRVLSSVTSSLSLSTTYTFSDYKFTDFVNDGNNYNGNELTGIPKHHLLASATITHKGFFGIVNYRYVSTMPMRDDNSIYSDAYNLFDIKMGYTYSAFLNRFDIELFGGINNLWNEKYASMILVNAGSFGGRAPRYYYPGLPRNFYGGVSLTYHFQKQ